MLTLVLLSRDAQDGAWGDHALDWLQARDLAAHRSVAELVLFESPDAWDVPCCYQSRPLHGRAEDAEVLAPLLGEPPNGGTAGRSYVDATGSVVEYRLPAVAHDVAPDELLVSEHAADGAATLMTHPRSLQFLQDPRFLGIQGFGRELAGAKDLTDRYLAAWSGRDNHALSSLYAPDATLTDSLLGVRLTGREAIGAYGVETAGARLLQDLIRRDGGPGLYGFWREPDSPLVAYLSYTGDDGTHCPGGVTAQLQIAHGHIVAERRFHDVASMRRCVNTAQLPDGWWAHATIPPPIQDQVTATLTVAGRRVEVHNGSPGAEELVRRALTRFPAARLAAPEVAVVAFDEEIHRQQCSSERWGLTLSAGSSSRIYLCFTVAGAPTAFQQQLLLHELAHAWLWQNLPGTTRQDFQALLHLRTWDARDVPWGRRGIEHAADVIVWGISQPPVESDLLAGRTCTQLTQAFRLLTHVSPLRQCPSTSVPPPTAGLGPVSFSPTALTPRPALPPSRRSSTRTWGR